MRRPPWTAIRIFLFLVALFPGFAHLAEAAAPTFEGIVTSPTLSSPRGTALAPRGDLFVGSGHRMERFDAAGNHVATWAFPETFLGPPNGVAIDGSGNVYALDMTRNRVLKLTDTGDLISGWGGGSMPVDLAVDGIGDVYIAEFNGKQVRKTSSNGAQLGTFGSGRFQCVVGIALDASGRIYGADNIRMRVVRLLANGAFDMEFAPPSPPSDVAVGPDGNIYVVSFESHSVYEYSPSGVFVRSFGSPAGLDGPFRIVIDATGMMYVTEQYNNRITKFQIDLSTPAIPSTFGRVKGIYR